MRKTQILFEATPMASSKKTGVGYYVDHLTTSLVRYHNAQLELTGYYFNFLHRNPPPAVQSVHFTAITFTPDKLLSLCRRLGTQPFLEFFTRKDSDVVLFTNYANLPLLRKRPTALIIYDLSYLDCPEFVQHVNLTFLQRFATPSIQRADLIITISEFAKERLLHHFPNLKANIIVTPIPPVEKTVKLALLASRLQGLGIESKAYLLFLSTIEPRKNVQNLVKAYALLPQKLRDQYPLVLAGGKGWNDAEILEEITSQQNKGLRIIQTGYISDIEKESLYSNAHGFVLPAHYEGFGMPVLEAIQYSIPVACSDIAVLRETAGKAALYFNKDSPQDIADNLVKLLTDQTLRQKLIHEGQKQLTTFSWKTNSDVVHNALAALL